MTNEQVICCFCGMPLPEREAVLAVLYPTAERDEAQRVYSHRQCLTKLMRPELPRHPALEDDE